MFKLDLKQGKLERFYACKLKRCQIFLVVKVSFWPVKQLDSEVKQFAQMAGLSWPKHKGIVRAHYTMDQKMGSDLLDESGNKLDGKLQGKPQWVQVREIPGPK